jgi:nitrogen fixation NifU-like protein
MSGPMDDFMDTIYRRISKSPAGQQDEPVPVAVHPPGNMKRMQNASCSAEITGTCKETMEIYLKVNEERIADASFFTDGCGFSIACGSVAARLALGKTADEAVQIGEDTILSAFRSPLPEGESHCAQLAAETLHAAIHEWMSAAGKK